MTVTWCPFEQFVLQILCELKDVHAVCTDVAHPHTCTWTYTCLHWHYYNRIKIELGWALVGVPHHLHLYMWPSLHGGCSEFVEWNTPSRIRFLHVWIEAAVTAYNKAMTHFPIWFDCCNYCQKGLNSPRYVQAILRWPLRSKPHHTSVPAWACMLPWLPKGVELGLGRCLCLLLGICLKDVI